MCGWLPAQVDEIEFRHAVDLVGYWNDHPPVHEMIAAYFGIKPEMRMTVQEIQDTRPPPGCLSIDELRKIAAAHPVSMLH